MATRSIKSPGVEIFENDLSLRASFNPGTSIVVMGFAPQGPISEPIQITTVSELETIFGLPVSPAERYFYYSCREVLATSGNLLAIRIPYGEGAGEGYSKAYSGLFYPMTSAIVGGPLPTQPVTLTLSALANVTILSPLSSTSLSASVLSSVSVGGTPLTLSGIFLNPSLFDGLVLTGTSLSSYSLSSVGFTQSGELSGFVIPPPIEWIIGAPSHVSMTEPQYLSLVQNDFVWKPPVSGAEDVIPNFSQESIDLKAGFFILNSLQTAINEQAEGYYVGFADNSAQFADSPNFDSIKSLKTLSRFALSTANFSEITNNRLDFRLSASQAESNVGITSISEQIEKVGFAGFATTEYQDHVSLGVFKIRRSTIDATQLTLGTSERHLGSFDFNRRKVSPSGGILSNSYLEDEVNNSSAYMRLFINPSISRVFDWTKNSTLPVNRVTVSEEAKALFPLGSYNAMSYDDELNKSIGEVPRKIDKIFTTIDNPENLIIDLIVDAGISTVYSTTKSIPGAKSYDENAFVADPTSLYEDWLTVATQYINFASKARKDCMALLDLPRPFFITGRTTKVIEKAPKGFTEISNNIKKCVDPIEGPEASYAATYGNWIKQKDLFTGKNVWLPFSAVAAARYAESDRNTYPWFAPAGLNRGIFNALDLAFNPNQKHRDTLYELAVNPVVFFNGDGFAIMGQKTMQNKPTAFDRVNVRRLFLTLERATQRALKFFVFEPNTEFTRTRLRNVISPLFEFAKNTQGVYDYLIVCDSRNNTPERIDNNELVVDIYIKPVRAAEFILVNFIATRTGQNFAELI